MKNFISKHATQAAYTAAESTFDKLHVAYIEELSGLANCVRYMEKHNYAKDYLTIESLQDNNTIGWKATSSSVLKIISISTDGGTTWTEKTSSISGTTLTTLNNGDKLLVKGSNTAYATSSYYNYFTSTGNFNTEGNIMSLYSGDNFTNQTTLDSAGYNFYRLFYQCVKLVSAENLILPSTTLFNYCYQQMFYGCTSLTTAPDLPATTLANYCYYRMFENCTSLTAAPELPATTLASGCYGCMFSGCTSLITAPELSATILTGGCYAYMFQGCTSLTTAPELLATTLTGSCYAFMFQNCTSLATAPELPATTLAQYCYDHMFEGCTSLTTAPALSATTLANYCYQMMFQGCIALTTAPELPATTLVNLCYYGMFTNCTSLNYIKCLATDISASYCTTNWLQNVAASGTFVKADGMSSWTTGTAGIPSNWTVQDAA